MHVGLASIFKWAIPIVLDTIIRIEESVKNNLWIYYFI
jgi:hypothetical protein